MANDIAANLSFQADADAKIADHINRFWAPRMRRLLLEHAAGNGEGLSEALLPALDKLRQ
jgi:formate dehydrogenase subunit delta